MFIAENKVFVTATVEKRKAIMKKGLLYQFSPCTFYKRNN